jgi:hypothetical protein
MKLEDAYKVNVKVNYSYSSGRSEGYVIDYRNAKEYYNENTRCNMYFKEDGVILASFVRYNKKTVLSFMSKETENTYKEVVSLRGELI